MDDLVLLLVVLLIFAIGYVAVCHISPSSTRKNHKKKVLSLKARVVQKRNTSSRHSIHLHIL